MSTTTATHAHPHPLDAAFLSVRYRNEVGIAEIPAPVQRVLFPVASAIGRLTGHHRRFAGAPAPMPPAGSAG